MCATHSMQLHRENHSPRLNRLLAALPQEDYERLRPDLELVSLPLGWTLHRAGDAETHLYFPISGVVSRYHVTEDGASAAYAVTGNEGVIGVALFLGDASTPNQAEVLIAGFAYRLGVARLHSEFGHVGALPLLLLRYTQALIVQTTQTSVCNRHHSVPQQFCRWLLACLDRMPSNELAMTQEKIADMLGVRREGITAAAGHLQKSGAIQYHRGHISVLDRAALEAQACECYAVVSSEIDRLIPPHRTATPPPVESVRFAMLSS